MHGWSILANTLVSINRYGQFLLSANLVRDASLDRRLSIVLLEIGLFFPVECMEFLSVWKWTLLIHKSQEKQAVMKTKST